VETESLFFLFAREADKMGWFNTQQEKVAGTTDALVGGYRVNTTGRP